MRKHLGNINARIKLFSNNTLITSRSFAFGIANEIMVPLDPPAISDWASQFSFDRFGFDFDPIPANTQAGTNIAVAKAAFDGQFISGVSNAWFCDTGLNNNLQCQNQLSNCWVYPRICPLLSPHLWGTLGGIGGEPGRRDVGQAHR